MRLYLAPLWKCGALNIGHTDRSFKVIEFSGNRKPVYEFVIVINSNQALFRTVIEIQRLIG